MVEEEVNLIKMCPDEEPPDFGLTVVVRPKLTTSEELLKQIKTVWSIVASWGRYCDEEKGGWPSPEECLALLPSGFKAAWEINTEFSFESWLDDLHERDWIWWSSAVLNDQIKIDLNNWSFPGAYWMLDFVIEKAGGEIIYRDQWINMKRSLELEPYT